MGTYEIHGTFWIPSLHCPRRTQHEISQEGSPADLSFADFAHCDGFCQGHQGEFREKPFIRAMKNRQLWNVSTRMSFREGLSMTIPYIVEN